MQLLLESFHVHHTTHPTAFRDFMPQEAMTPLLILPPRSCQPPAGSSAALPSRGTGRGLHSACRAKGFARSQLRSHLSHIQPSEAPRRSSSPRATCPANSHFHRAQRASRGGTERGNDKKQQHFTAVKERCYEEERR